MMTPTEVVGLLEAAVDGLHGVALEQPPAGPTVGGIVAGAGTMSVRDLALKHGVDPERLRKRLETWRSSNDDGHTEVKNRRPRDARYLYDERTVLPVIERLKSQKLSGQRPAQKKST